MSEGIAGARLLRVRDGRGGVHIGVASGGELEILDSDDMLATLERGELPKVVQRVAILERRLSDLADRVRGCRRRCLPLL